MRDVEHDRVDVAALGPELLVQQIAGALGLGPGQSEIGGVAVADRPRDDGGEDRDHDPGRDNPATVADAPSRDAQHGGVLLHLLPPLHAYW